MVCDKKQYLKNRYDNDPVYRAKILARTTEYRTRNKDLINARRRFAYKNRTTKEIEERKIYLNRLRPGKKEMKRIIHTNICINKRLMRLVNHNVMISIETR